MYKFLRRHVYSPLRARGWSHTTASVIVFLLSAALHELLVGVPTHNMIGEIVRSSAASPPTLPTLNRGEVPADTTLWS